MCIEKIRGLQVCTVLHTLVFGVLLSFFATVSPRFLLQRVPVMRQIILDCNKDFWWGFFSFYIRTKTVTPLTV